MKDRQGRAAWGDPPPWHRPVAALMTDRPPIVPSHLTISAARKIAVLKSACRLLVECAGRLVGSLEPHALARCSDDEPISTVMTELCCFVNPTTSVAQAHELLVRHHLDWLPVTAGTFLVGTVAREALERANTGPWSQPGRFERNVVRPR